MFYKIIVTILKFLVFIIFDLKVHNAERINDTKDGLIACGNHISMIDPVILAVSSKRQIHFMGKKELFENKFFGFVFKGLGAFPVDRQGISLSAIKSSLQVLNQKKVLGIFPEGTRVRQYNEDNAKPGIALIANKAKVNILPFYIKGTYKFRGKIEIFFGDETNYFEIFDGKASTEKYTEIGKEILRDIYKLEDR
ncbi:1-acyl-sn-glycerol-3-phosphate acyltransferase [Sedimentibacter hydroxybenzoicus DSM 7310]|uniref:1-acyl-sn-glycerol-3-phosphate acyltransferase n=1 Tax=Sedimentibacter hydroxybenzoicus DSM 7310 TaxID=1123245 RepID=A0A974BIT2_SEDHY|nr:lysophospholipid acyltransferase family protein [Sedimentibacter hydroxybenzoicus]NYB73547.1 1-acyl-sn-glycerol-3-phosphate acyltransferase [Sedimentibacter hydroxybenzoicus DSM 7310]